VNPRLVFIFGAGVSAVEFGKDSLIELVEHLACVAECRESNTSQHARRVGVISAALAQDLGLSEELVELIRLAAPLHDVGKIRIPEHILLKPGALTPEEFEVMKTHVTIGARILSGGKLPLLRMAEEIALTHHERWDGTGYPQGLKGETIPLPGRIVALADAFDALISVRLYRAGRSIAEAVSEIKRHAGTQFDPRVVEAFLVHSPGPGTARLRIQTITR
jgi:putative two-component system response regulator